MAQTDFEYARSSSQTAALALDAHEQLRLLRAQNIDLQQRLAASEARCQQLEELMIVKNQEGNKLESEADRMLSKTRAFHSRASPDPRGNHSVWNGPIRFNDSSVQKPIEHCAPQRPSSPGEVRWQPRLHVKGALHPKEPHVRHLSTSSLVTRTSELALGAQDQADEIVPLSDEDASDFLDEDQDSSANSAEWQSTYASSAEEAEDESEPEEAHIFTFNIPDETLKQARDAAPESLQSF